MLCEAFAEEGEAFGGEGEADGVGVAAEAGEDGDSVVFAGGGVDCGEGVEQVEAGDGAARAVGLAVFVGEDEGGAAGAVDDARGEDAEDAAVPGGVVEDDAGGGEGLGFGIGAHGFELGFDGGEGFGFGGAAGVD